MENAEIERKLRKRAHRLAQLSFVCNLVSTTSCSCAMSYHHSKLIGLFQGLLIAKAVAAGLSGSLAVISSVIDSAVDLVSGALMWWSTRAMANRDIYQYPQGRTKLEPIAVIILAVVMALASVQMLRESVEKIVMIATQQSGGPDFTIATVVICAVTVGMSACTRV